MKRTIHVLSGINNDETFDYLQSFSDDVIQLFNNDDILNQLSIELQIDDYDIVIQGNHLTRDSRIPYYNLAMQHNYNVKIHVFYNTFKQLIKFNKSKEYLGEEFDTYDVCLDKYISFQVPKVGLDCTSYVFHNLDYDEIYESFTTEMSFNNVNHSNPYHLEPISHHINECKSLSLTDKYKDFKELFEIAKYHDLGKGRTRQELVHNTQEMEWYNRNYGKYFIYPEHQNIGAIHALLLSGEQLINDYDYTNNNDIVEAILYHDMIKDNHEQYYVDKYKITERQLQLIRLFNEINTKASIPNYHAIHTMDKIEQGITMYLDDYQKSLKEIKHVERGSSGMYHVINNAILSNSKIIVHNNDTKEFMQDYFPLATFCTIDEIPYNERRDGEYILHDMESLFNTVFSTNESKLEALMNYLNIDKSKSIYYTD